MLLLNMDMFLTFPLAASNASGNSCDLCCSIFLLTIYVPELIFRIYAFG
jgi:hypothetical protein